ncbi:unnamed protein product [Choristocarpus tenellus]
MLEELNERTTGFTVSTSEDKGRICVANQAFEPGMVIFNEKAFVYASEIPDRCLACSEEHTCEHCPKLLGGRLNCPEELAGDLDDLAEELRYLDGINTLDRARCWIQCLLMYRTDPKTLSPVERLTCANLPRCLDAVQVARGLLPGLFPDSLGDDAAARLLGVLNTNSHALEEVEGSGLFLLACMMEHSCVPNCSFTTYGDKLWLTAIAPIKTGDSLSIDYGNNYYTPTVDRQADLEETYGFVCNCKGCSVLPDLSRAFHCPTEGCEGKVCPCGDGGESSGERLPSEWECLKCGHQCAEVEIGVMLVAEEGLAQALEEAEVEGVEDIEILVSEARVVHPGHCVAFWALDNVAKFLSQDPTMAEEAERTWSRVVAAMDEVLPELHHERVVYYDALAQARVMAGDLEGAREAYWNAHRVSVLVSGADCPPTRDIKALAQSPPTTPEELLDRYNC